MSRESLETARPHASVPGGRPLSILQIVTCRGWSSDAWAAVNLCLGLQEEGHRVMLMCRGTGGGKAVANRAREEGVREVGFVEASTRFRPASYLRDISLIKSLARSRALDVVHVHRGVEHWLAAAAWLRRDGPVVVRSRHIFHPVRRHLFNRWLYRRGTDRTVAVCKKIRAAYLEGGVFSLEQFAVVMGGVDASAYDPADDGAGFRQEWGIPDDVWLIGAAGSLAMWMKGQDVLLRAVARMERGGSSAPWVMLVGKGGDMKNLKKLAARLGISGRTVVTGHLENLAPALAACNALAFPSLRSEGTSRVLFDYLAAGRPVVASRVGCVDEIVRDEREGLLVPPGDEVAMEKALSRFRLEPRIARQMGESARCRAVEEFDRRVMARAVVDIYREAARMRRVSAA
ncbi:MAG: glycosyltransferase family 4 protein [bacterium]